MDLQEQLDYLIDFKNSDMHIHSMEFIHTPKDRMICNAFNMH